MKIRFINLIYKACSCIVISVFLINISKYHLKSVTQETLFNLRVKLHSYLQTQFIQPTIDRDKYSMSRSIQTNTFIFKKNIEPLSLTTLFVHAASVMGVNVFEDIEVGSH